MREQLIRFISAAAVLCALIRPGLTRADVYDMDEIFAGLGKSSSEAGAQVLAEVVHRLEPGDVLNLSRRHASGDVDITGIPDNVTIQYGFGGRMFMSEGVYRGMRIRDTDMELYGVSGPEGLGRSRASRNRVTLENAYITNSPMVNNVNMAGSKIVDVRAGGDGRGFWEQSGSWTDNSLVYLFYHTGNPDHQKHIYFNGCDATNSCVYGIVEVNYCHPKVSVAFENTKGLFYGVGDTERHNSPAGVYQIMGCQDLTLVCHRNYHPHGKCTDGNGYLVSGGGNVTFFGVSDIGASKDWSVRMKDCKNFSMISTFLENVLDRSGSTGDPFYLFFTPDGFGDVPNTQWVAPAVVDDEVVISYKGKSIDSHSSGSVDLSGVQFPKPPLIKPFDDGGSSGGGGRKARAAEAASTVTTAWGSAAIAAGVDIAGARSSHAAVQQLLDAGDVVELPRGTLTFAKPVRIAARPGRRVRILGAGSAATTISVTGNFPPFVIDRSGLPRAGSAAEPLEGLKVEFQGQTFDGNGSADAGVELMGGAGYQDDHLWDNCTFKNFMVAGVFIGDMSKLNDPTYYVNGDGYDQFRYKNCTFSNTGKYGIFSNREMIDKQLVYNCTFDGQSVAGISYMRSHMVEASSFVLCTFRNIDGPGIELGGNNKPGVGTATGPNMIMNCLFEECGNAKRPAVDYGWARQNVFVKNRIVLKTKPWKYAYTGTACVFQQNSIEVDPGKGLDGALATAIRHPRQWGNGRVTGNNISNCTSNGKLGFINDVDEFVSYYGDNVAMPAGKVDYPYANTHLVADCVFGDQTINYSLFRTAKDGSVLSVTDLESGSTVTSPAPDRAVKQMPHRTHTVYDLHGRRIGRMQAEGIAPTGADARRSAGIRILSSSAAGPGKVTMVHR